jgi:diadenosine tetraphosphate (Ap4A) HIT family hydrolase
VAEFILDPAFESGSVAVGDLPLCHVRLQNDARWPWLILIPRLPGLREIEDLSAVNRHHFIKETVRAGHAVRCVGEAVAGHVEKLNVGALGNITSQLHMHVVGRRTGDPAWPGPVWGFGVAESFEAFGLDMAVLTARKALNL